MPPTPSPPTARRLAVRALVAAVALAAVPLAGCGAPPDLRDAGRSAPPAPADGTPTASASGPTAPPAGTPPSLGPGGTPATLPPDGTLPTPPPDGTLPTLPPDDPLPTGRALPTVPGVPPTTLPGAPTTAVPVVPAPPPAPVVTPCPGRPSAAAVLTLLRGPGGVLSRNVAARVTLGPLCAESWHYTVLDVTGHEELQAVTRSGSDGLTLVTAGTDVCSTRVAVDAPPGIRALACDADTVAVPGA
ncbi:hypothetical protein [Micromonospora mirobrigensis]|uniref:Uncharacterized protein n=1 Tax=Micromonospora mirobrigensis TaxID=262898 RepID=A0A1C5ACR8_9ACTN|nr:hypothetical protein [Micromonospora mirobrigensis]SCF43003.1 hypothetical protein GA0070564_10944 [Micromonospora mirobrigensis]